MFSRSSLFYYMNLYILFQSQYSQKIEFLDKCEGDFPFYTCLLTKISRRKRGKGEILSNQILYHLH